MIKEKSKTKQQIELLSLSTFLSSQLVNVNMSWHLDISHFHQTSWERKTFAKIMMMLMLIMIIEFFIKACVGLLTQFCSCSQLKIVVRLLKEMTYKGKQKFCFFAYLAKKGYKILFGYLNISAWMFERNYFYILSLGNS